MVYDKRQATVKGMLVSMIRDTNDLHYTEKKGSMTGEIMVQVDGDWEDCWAGYASDAGHMFRQIVAGLERGMTLGEVDEAIANMK